VNQRLLVACLGIAVALGMVAMGQTVKKTRKAQAPAQKSDAESTPSSDPKKDTGTENAKESETKPAKSSDKTTTPKLKKIEKATFGGGCFWCMEAVFERIPGVKSVVSGYSGGSVPNPTYEMVCTGLTGHAEVIQIEFDPNVLGFDKLLKFFWSAHDPTTLNSQGPDFGTQYRSIIFYHSEEQKEEALKQYKELMAHRGRRSPIVTELVPFTAFYPADDYHQDYYRNHPDADYSQMFIEPKVRKLKKMLK
jgi:peptide-methionine (S)-S-oxide reductase